MATQEANESVKHALEKQASQQKAKKRKVHTHFPESRLADMQPRIGMPLLNGASRRNSRIWEKVQHVLLR